MRVKFAHTIIFVKDIEVSRKFYAELLGIKIIQDHKIFLFFEGNFALHQAKELDNTIFKREIKEDSDLQGRNNIDIYFECNEIEKIYARLEENHIRFIHSIEKQPWGQNVFRFYDPDLHIIEIGEPSFKTFDE